MWTECRFGSIHVPGKGHLTAFAEEFGAFALRFFSDYYGIPYPGDKLDLLAIPDFAAGAMENLGAVTFRETLLLIDPGAATQDELLRVADVIAHELAHMWFGDLVTMRWWNGLWLKEAFATFMEMVCVDAYRPAWRRWAAFAASRDNSMDTDGLRSTRPIEFPVASPDDADAMFDVITYSKGAAVLRMLQQFLGEDTFRAGHLPLSAHPCVRQRRDAPPVGGARGRIRRTGSRHHGVVDLPGWPPADRGDARPTRVSASPGAVPVHRRIDRSVEGAGAVSHRRSAIAVWWSTIA